MKLIEIWERLGRQPYTVTNNTDAVVIVNGRAYVISNIHYHNGRFIAFETKPYIEENNKEE
jgi:hypothetical protein